MSRALGVLVCLALLSASYPLWRAYRAKAGTSLQHALIWGASAWLVWLTSAALLLFSAPSQPLRYLALVLTAGALVAVLGARRPGVAAWNFVIAGLLAVLSLPLLEQPWKSPTWHLDAPRAIFLAAVLGVGILNYFPTRLGLSAAVLAVAVTLELWDLVSPEGLAAELRTNFDGGPFLVALAIWLGYATILTRKAPKLEIDSVWMSFRDSYGLVWGRRVQEQFNSAATHAGWNVRLGWAGIQSEKGITLSEDQWREMSVTLRAILKRFGISTADAALSE